MPLTSLMCLTDLIEGWKINFRDVISPRSSRGLFDGKFTFGFSYFEDFKIVMAMFFFSIFTLGSLLVLGCLFTFSRNTTERSGGYFLYDEEGGFPGSL